MKKYIIVSCIGLFILFWYLYWNNQTYYAVDFNIKELYSSLDEDNDGTDDYHDILEGARIDAENMVKYKSAYYAGGYPPEDEGVCSDLVWRALQNAGYNLKDLIDEDIMQNKELYPGLDNGKPDPNIDFRRVRNLKVFFDRNAKKLTTDITKIEEWQPGDIVIFGDNYNHIGIISDKRNYKGIPYLIHNAGQKNREEDALKRYVRFSSITGHYRWNFKGGK